MVFDDAPSQPGRVREGSSQVMSCLRFWFLLVIVVNEFMEARQPKRDRPRPTRRSPTKPGRSRRVAADPAAAAQTKRQRKTHGGSAGAPPSTQPTAPHPVVDTTSVREQEIPESENSPQGAIYLTLAEAAEMYGLPPALLAQAVAERRVRALHLEGGYFLKVSAIDEALRAGRLSPPPSLEPSTGSNSQEESLITLAEAADILHLPHAQLAQAVLERRIRVWRRDELLLTTQASIEEAIASGQLQPGDSGALPNQNTETHDQGFMGD